MSIFFAGKLFSSRTAQIRNKIWIFFAGKLLSFRPTHICRPGNERTDRFGKTLLCILGHSVYFVFIAILSLLVNLVCYEKGKKVWARLSHGGSNCAVNRFRYSVRGGNTSGLDGGRGMEEETGRSPCVVKRSAAQSSRLKPLEGFEVAPRVQGFANIPARLLWLPACQLFTYLNKVDDGNENANGCTPTWTLYGPPSTAWNKSK